MVKILISDDNIYYATHLMNCINDKNENIRVIGIAQNGLETIQKIETNDIDIILLDLIMPLCDGYQVLNKISKNKKLFKSCIVISGDITDIYKIKNNNTIYKILSKGISIDNIVKEINELVTYKDQINCEITIENKIRHELTFLGYDVSHNGTTYLIETIKYIKFNPNKELEKLEKTIYPIISKKYQKSVHTVKCSINRATTYMYCQCEIERLKRYFHFYIDKKPNIKTIITTIINKI